MPLDKYHLSLAGEYRVASELLKRNVFATITFGNAKGADIYAIGPNRRTAIVEVKSSSNSDKIITRFFQTYQDEMRDRPDFWVLYTMKDFDDEEFYILTHAEMAQAQKLRNYPGKTMTYAEQAAAAKKGVDNVLAKDIQEHNSAWWKITKYLEIPAPL